MRLPRNQNKFGTLQRDLSPLKDAIDYQLTKAPELYLFVGLCVVSRASSIIARDPASAAEAIHVASIFTHQARRRMSRNIRGETHNEDDAVDALAQLVLYRGSYRWDVL